MHPCQGDASRRCASPRRLQHAESWRQAWRYRSTCSCITLGKEDKRPASCFGSCSGRPLDCYRQHCAQTAHWPVQLANTIWRKSGACGKGPMARQLKSEQPAHAWLTVFIHTHRCKTGAHRQVLQHPLGRQAVEVCQVLSAAGMCRVQSTLTAVARDGLLQGTSCCLVDHSTTVRKPNPGSTLHIRCWAGQ